ncbi:hypothetical protein [Streptococcus pluranimalium]|uniref:Uncharacterized protein n=1 Tax=Streptococcus pluranimalium TaxID=82348 RepID=A0A345VIL3_9STRE|nr:hypothetical protein [Streptococcus pluranimalium]AXJ12565.1 hypothetical protein Sp14A_06360 [Streptococcus pluranimalium]
MSDKTKLTWLNGSVIKQGDTSSVFKLKLRTDDNVALNGPAKLQLIQDQSKIEYETEVVKNQVAFNLPQALPVGNYIIEIEHAGYVFPSTNSIVLTINENLGDVITDEVAELLTVDEYIKQKLADFQTGQIDLDELASKLTIPQYDDGPLTTQISDILAEISVLKQSQEQSVQYDDSELKSRLTALENKTDNDTIYDDTIIDQRLTALESRPVGSSYDDTAIRNEIAVLKAKESYDDTEVKTRLTALERSNGSNSTTNERFGPTGWFLDRSVSPWQFRFDNGSSLTLGNVDQRVYIYPESTPLTQEAASEYRVITTLMRFAMGSNTLTTIASRNGIARFWNNGAVTNPVNDSSGFNFTNAVFNPNDTNGPSKRAQPIMIRCYYELGVFTKSDILSLGATEI